eukprot:CAMPEP_0183339054 /NCGR_PEP_ID=MMETSP0164_2-20130417/6123_1 /TAXON_ID=221442 /ORGANISM="Coccolithus pelagicus ssp braarudi, Strain PLY182g" /LENGTH=43 /DNA_ID= /DNA_START= /DNA_END= /DNA_ORIENTATION=
MKCTRGRSPEANSYGGKYGRRPAAAIAMNCSLSHSWTDRVEFN